MIVESKFKPLWYLKNPHLQTLLANLIHPAFPHIRYETVDLPDGDNLQLARGTASGKNTVLILHGLEGSLKSSYAQRLINSCNEQGIPVVFMFFRGCNGTPNKQIRSYHSGETGDLRAVIDYLKQQGIERIALVGYSLGGNVVLKYMGERKTDASVVCASAVSVPLLLDICASRMNRGFSRIYQYALLQRLIRKVQQKKSLLLADGYTTPAETLKTFVEFDNAFTAPTHGFKDAQQYYQRCSSRQFLAGINKPTLLIHSLDDPFMTTAVIPAEHELAPQVTLELSLQGGHVGFIGGRILKPVFWLEPRIIEFLQREFLSSQCANFGSTRPDV
ncbi:MAG: hydrolase [Gammaproteobacteria bacterium]|nr:hydrolase [Gammaproteobacteria bacterium]MBL7000688.1 hydrolase [Gammaproteobacteria bacterium]